MLYTLKYVVPKLSIKNREFLILLGVFCQSNLYRNMYNYVCIYSIGY